MGKKFYYQNNRNNRADKLNDNSSDTVSYSAEKLNMTLDVLGFSDYAKTVLDGGKIKTAADLVRRTERDMFRVQGLNKRVLNEVKTVLEKNGMALKDFVQQAPQTDGSSRSQTVPVRNTGDKTAADNTLTEREQSRRRTDNGRGNRVISENGQRDRRENGERTARNDGYGKNSDRFAGRNSANKISAAPERPPKLTEPLPVDEWRKIQKGGKWGFYDGFKTVIPAMYDEVFGFKDGLASVELDEKCGYIDSENNIIIPLEYDTAMSFSEGLASVVRGTKCGYINKENEVVIPFDYDAATRFEDGEAKIKKDGRWGTITVENKITWI